MSIMIVRPVIMSIQVYPRFTKEHGKIKNQPDLMHDRIYIQSQLFSTALDNTKGQFIANQNISFRSFSLKSQPHIKGTGFPAPLVITPFVYLRICN